MAILFTVRSKLLRTHSGEVSFPGGRVDPTDVSPLGAALRETHEEIGVESSSLLVLGPLPRMPDRSGSTEVFSFVSIACWMPWTDNDASLHATGGIRTLEDLPKSQWDSLRMKSVEDLKLVLNRDEVDSCFIVPLDELLDPSKRSEEDFRGSKGIKIPTWFGPNQERIWGLTAFVLDHLLKHVIVPAQQQPR
ncbi:UNVERIFIED_CONTAM: nudix (nucleoside diphosphate linked moiety X)-type motif 8 [Siphonaria sp. JEL0065]|nr:nudix (nucleoside diphosphate linked moiety X)-type motif 8 [Siphonaria sp. JEL0065]